MNEQLRPLNLGEILDRTLQLYRARFLVLLGIAALPAGLVLAMASAIFLMVLGFGPGGPAANSPVLAGVLAVLFFLGAAFVALPLLVAALALCRAALNHAAAGACRGEKIDIRSAPGRFRAWPSRSLYPAELENCPLSPNIDARETQSVRSWWTSGASGPNAWSMIATATISTTSVKLMPNRLTKVKNLRRRKTLYAILR